MRKPVSDPRPTPETESHQAHLLSLLSPTGEPAGQYAQLSNVSSPMHSHTRRRLEESYNTAEYTTTLIDRVRSGDGTPLALATVAYYDTLVARDAPR
jgi:hypothetical protein